MTVTLSHDVLVGAEPVPHCTHTLLTPSSAVGTLALLSWVTLTQVDVEAEQVRQQHGREQRQRDGDGGQAGNHRRRRAERSRRQEDEPRRRVVARCNTATA